MTVVQIEHPVRTFDAWKAAFDADPVGRETAGVRRYRVYRPVEDPAYIAVDLEFDDGARASAFTEAMERLWASGRAAPALAGTPRIRIVEVVEDRTYGRVLSVGDPPSDDASSR